MSGDGLLDGMNSHPLRKPLNEEMHMRRLESVALPMQMLQIVSLFGPGGAAEANGHLRQILPNGEPFSQSSKYHRCKLGALDLIWERHTEFASCTFIAPGRPADLFSMEPFKEIDRDWLAATPGQLIRSTRLALVEPDVAPDPVELKNYFFDSSLVRCFLHNSKAELFSDFRLHKEGCGRVLIVARGLEGPEPAQTVQLVQELGNYRKLALLGLPDAQRGMVALDALEVRLGTATQEIAREGSPADQLLSVISKLSAELATLTAATRYRMYASAAYGELVEDRLRSLRVSPISGFSTLEDFTERRLFPALRTCASFQRRLDDLAARAQSATALLRTKVDTALASQNRDLLESMNRRAIAQLRLQETVEGLSIVAVSYYAFGLFKAWIEPFHGRIGESATNWISLAAVPLIVGAVWLTLRRARHRWARETAADQGGADRE